MVVRFVLPQSSSRRLLEGVGRALLEPINKCQTIRVRACAINQQVQVVRHETVRLNIETFLFGSLGQEFEMFTNQAES